MTVIDAYSPSLPGGTSAWQPHVFDMHDGSWPVGHILLAQSSATSHAKCFESPQPTSAAVR